MNGLKFILEKSEHEKNIFTAFGGDVFYREREPKLDKPLVVILFTNRSGSNLFAEYLSGSGYVGGLAEATNFPHVLRQKEKFGFSSYADLVAADAQVHLSQNKSYGLKLSAAQLAMLHRWNILAMFPEVAVIQIVRENLLDQAISMSIAKQTGKWSSKVNTDGDLEPVFEFDDISRFISRTSEQNVIGRILVEALEVKHAQFKYEDFSRNPRPYVLEALSIVGVDYEDVIIPEPTLKKQANQTNLMFRRMYLDEISSQIDSC